MTLPLLWEPDRDDTLVCAGVRDETSDVRTIVLRAEPERLFRFLPGQFMTLELEAAGLQRCYTIASPPTRPFRLEITTKRSGPGSAWLHDHVHPGTRLRAIGPFGEFSFGPAPRGKYLFLAAGSGITPLMSMARTAHDLGSDADIVLVQSVRAAHDLLFAGELASMSARPGLRAASIVERDQPGARWDGYRGRLSAAILAAVAPDLLERDVFCCGPAPYMDAVRGLLAASGYDMRRYREESFAFAAAAPEPKPAAYAETSTDGYKIVFSTSGRTITCAPDTMLLQAAHDAGLRLPSACKKGVCGTCKSRLSSGTVEMKHGGGIRQREIDAGLVLLCCARPASDLVIER